MTQPISKRHEDPDALTEFTAQNDGPPSEKIGDMPGFSWWAKEEATMKRLGLGCVCGMHMCDGNHSRDGEVCGGYN
jgi:hypothetical protein